MKGKGWYVEFNIDYNSGGAFWSGNNSKRSGTAEAIARKLAARAKSAGLLGDKRPDAKLFPDSNTAKYKGKVLFMRII